MARHWSVFVRVTEKQAYAIDKMAEVAAADPDSGFKGGDGCDLLAFVGDYSRSKVGKLDRLSLRPTIDETFRRFGRK